MSWTDVIQFVFLLILALILLNTRVPVCPHNYNDLALNHGRVQKIWDHFYTYEVHQWCGQYRIRRISTIDQSVQDTGAWLTEAEARAHLKKPQSLTGWYSAR